MAIVVAGLVDGSQQVEFLNDSTRGQVEVLPDDILELLVTDHAGTEGIDEDGDWIGDADGIAELDFALRAELVGHQVLGDVTGHVGGTAVDLRRILATESPTAVTTHASVGIHNDFPAGHASIASGASDDKAAGRVDVVLGVLGQHSRRLKHRLDHLVHQEVVDLLFRSFRLVLVADDDTVDGYGFAILVDDGNLAL